MFCKDQGALAGSFSRRETHCGQLAQCMQTRCLGRLAGIAVPPRVTTITLQKCVSCDSAKNSAGSVCCHRETTQQNHTWLSPYWNSENFRVSWVPTSTKPYWSCDKPKPVACVPGLWLAISCAAELLLIPVSL